MSGTMELRVLLISPRHVHWGDDKKIRFSLQVPLGLAYLRACLAFFSPETDVRLIDGIAENAATAQFLSLIEEYSPDIIGITVLTPKAHEILSLAGQIRKRLPDVTIIAGGTHGWIFPEDLISHEVFDAVIIGEGERIFQRVVDAVRNREQLSRIPGVVTPDNLQQATREPLRLKCLDELPFPLRGVNERSPPFGALTSISTSRGCPYNCVFCIHPYAYGSKVRYRSISNVVEEIAYCKQKLGVETIQFTDSNFTLSPERTIGICKSIISRGIDIQWLCQTRPDSLAGPEETIQEMLCLMKMAGCVEIHLGIESGSPKVLESMGKPHSLDDVRTAVGRIRYAGIRVRGLFVIGCPGETPGTVAETVAFAKSLNLDGGDFALVTPHPGTELYTVAAKESYLVSQADSDGSVGDVRELAMLNLPGLPANHAAALRRWAVRAYYGSPSYVFNKLRKLVRNPNPLELRASFYGARGVLRHAMSNLCAPITGHRFVRNARMMLDGKEYEKRQ